MEIKGEYEERYTEIVDELNRAGLKLQTVADSLEKYEGETAGAQCILLDLRDELWGMGDDLNRFSIDTPA